MTATIWNPGTTDVVDAANTVRTQSFVATAGQEVLTLTEFEYVMGAGSVLLFKNGELLAPVTDFQELSPTEVRLTVDAAAGEKYTVLAFVRIFDVESTLDSQYEALATYWLGIQASDPTVDRLGRPLVAGAQYWNSTTGGKIYTGTAWVAMGVAVAGAMLATQNLADLTNKQTARQNLGVQQYTTSVPMEGQRSKTVSVANAAAVVGAKVLASVIAVAGTNRQDEMELEAFTVTGYCLVAGTVRISLKSLWGPLVGTYTVTYTIQP